MPYEDTDWSTADDTAKETAQHFFADSAGAHVTTTEGDATTGKNVLLSSDGLDVRDGSVLIGFFHGDEAQVGSSDAPHITLGSDALEMFVTLYAQVFKALKIHHNGSWTHIDSPLWPLWINSAGNLTLATGDGIADMYIRGRAYGFVVADENGNQLWKGTAQELADALDAGTLAEGDVRYDTSTGDTEYYDGSAWQVATPAGYMYGGSTVKTVTATREPIVFSNAEVRSMFNVTSGNEKEVGLTITNGDYGAQAHRITSVQYRSSSGWTAYLDGNAGAGAFRFNYLAFVPKGYSSI